MSEVLSGVPSDLKNETYFETKMKQVFETIFEQRVFVHKS